MSDTINNLETCTGQTLGEMVKNTRRLIDGVQTRADGTEVIDSYWDDATIKYYLNRSYTRLLQILVLNGEGEYGVWVDKDILPNQTRYRLPYDCLRVERILHKANDLFVPIQYSKDPAEPESGTSDVGLHLRFRYRLEGRDIVLYPTPRAYEQGTLRLEYFRGWPKMGCGNDPDNDRPGFDFLPIWCDVLVAHAAASCVEQERGQVENFARREKELELILINFGKPRSNQRHFISPYDHPEGDGSGSYGPYW